MLEMASESRSLGPLSLMILSGCTTVIFASALAYVLVKTKSIVPTTTTTKTSEEKPEKNGDKATTDSDPQRNGIDREKYPGGAIYVYFATQTGTSESFARQLEREGPEHGFLIHVEDVEDCSSLENLVEESRRDEQCGVARAIVLSSTYGEGEPPDNCKAFADALAEKASCDIIPSQQQQANSSSNGDRHQHSPTTEQPPKPPEPEPECCCLLRGLDYCVFGLGNKQYDNFCSMGKFFDRALELVGGNRILPLGIGNDDDDLDGDFESWKDGTLWPALEERYIIKEEGTAGVAAGPAQPAKNNKNNLPDCHYVVEFLDKEENPATTTPTRRDGVPLEEVHASSRHYFTAVDCPVTAVRELRTKEDPGSTVHVELDISSAAEVGGGHLTYETADNLGVLPHNDGETVASVAQSLGYDLDATFVVKAAPDHEWQGAPFPMPITVRECLTRYCDLTCAPRRSDLKLLASYAKDPTDRKALQRMSSKEGRAEYKEKILEGLVGLVNLFQLCPSIELPLEHFLAMCPPLQTRFFTISSSSSVHPAKIHLTVAVTNETRKDGTPFKGVCSNYLARCKPGKDVIRVFRRPSGFRLPEDSSRPIIMIGPGTGVAPMRALLQERSHQKTIRKQVVGKNILYFGCKRSTQDYIYEDELKELREEGILDELHVAFSREQKEKIYVQHLLQRNARETWKLIDEEGAYVYVCGGVKMGHDVTEAFKAIISSQGKLSSDDARDYWNKLTHDGRHVQELWS